MCAASPKNHLWASPLWCLCFTRTKGACLQSGPSLKPTASASPYLVPCRSSVRVWSLAHVRGNRFAVEDWHISRVAQYVIERNCISANQDHHL